MQQSFAGQRVVVMGLGLWSGGVAATRYLAAQGAKVCVTDLKSEADLAKSLVQLGDVPDLTFRLGEHREEDFLHADLIVANPAVPPWNRFLEIAREHGIPITTEVALFIAACPAQIVGVTGTVGKSTTATMIFAVLEAARRRSWLGGNIGNSLLLKLPQMTADDVVILELSSYQLSRLDHCRLRPLIGVVTNLIPNHLEWHGGFENYAEAKRSLYQHADPQSWAVLNCDDEQLRSWRLSNRQFGFGTEDRGELGVYGLKTESSKTVVRTAAEEREFDLLDWNARLAPHDWRNARAAIAGATLLDVDFDRIRVGIAGFTGLAYRQEFFLEIEGRSFIDDSKATSPAATMAAIKANGHRRIRLICGGANANHETDELISLIAAQCEQVATMGQSGASLAERINSSKPIATHHETLQAAVKSLWQASRAGDVILLSPAAPSHDQFVNFEQRGEAFKRVVQQLSQL